MNIAIDGMDGVGKTTVGKKIAEKMDYNFIEDPIKEYLNMDEKEYKNMVRYIRKSNNTNIPFVYYSLRHMIACQKEEKGKIIDRSMASTYFFESKNIDDKYFEDFQKLGANPDLTILLYANTEERIKRIKKRDINDEDLKSNETFVNGYAKMREYLEKFKLPYLLIDTTNLDLDKTVDLCSDIITTYEKSNDNERKEIIKNINYTFMYNFVKEAEKIKANKKIEEPYRER